MPCGACRRSLFSGRTIPNAITDQQLLNNEPLSLVEIQLPAQLHKFVSEMVYWVWNGAAYGATANICIER